MRPLREPSQQYPGDPAVPSNPRRFRFVKRNWKSIVIVVIGVPVVATIGVVRWNDAPSKDADSADSIAAASPKSTTSSTLVLDRRNYKPGDCVNWNQDVSKGGAEKTTRVVPCDQSHLFEYVTKVELPDGGTFPTEAEWEAIIARNCDAPTTAYLGYPLDEYGKFGVSVIQPTDDSWKMRDRTLNCGIGVRTSRSPLNPQEMTPFTGSVKGQDQTHLIPVGACYSYTSAESGGEVPCTEPHGVEIVGHVDISATKTRPQNDDQWYKATAACESLAKAYAPSAAKSGFDRGYLYIQPSSWDAGRRVTECTLAKYDASGNPVDVTGSVKG